MLKVVNQIMLGLGLLIAIAWAFKFTIHSELWDKASFAAFWLYAVLTSVVAIVGLKQLPKSSIMIAKLNLGLWVLFALALFIVPSF